MKTILVVESNLFVQKMYTDSLQEILSNIKINKANTFMEAQTMMTEKKYDLYVLAGSLEGGHSNSLLHLIEPQKVIVITGNLSYYNDLHEKGIMAFMKPFSTKKFVVNKAIFEKVLNKIPTSDLGYKIMGVGLLCISVSLYWMLGNQKLILQISITLGVLLIITGMILNRKK